MLQVLVAQWRDTTTLEARISGKLNGFSQDLGHMGKEAQSVKKDVGVFSAIKHLVTDTELETRTAAINADLKLLTAQTSGFAEHLNGYLLKTEAVERDFHEHIATAFSKVEREFAEVKDVVQGVSNAGADAGNAVPWQPCRSSKIHSTTAQPASRQSTLD